MRPIALDDILGRERYGQVREAVRRRIIEHKRARRVAVGDRLSLVFEDRATVWYQTQEMLWVEHVTDLDAIREELAVYNELLPSATYPISQTRATPDRWNHATGKPDAGLSGKLGINSNVTLDGTVNPDFSQVESDAFQVQVNQRFPVFFGEKRPFFMEGLGLFNIAGTGGDGNMRIAVHTRRIVDPAWGAKLTGTSNGFTFGVLSASDETPQDVGDRGLAIADKNKLFTIARATYGLGESNYIGAITTDTEHAGRHNRVAGGDVSWRFGSSATA